MINKDFLFFFDEAVSDDKKSLFSSCEVESCALNKQEETLEIRVVCGEFL